jgi:hypothetical protein
VYKCTEAGINSHITVPSKVCASQVFMKVLKWVKFCSHQIIVREEGVQDRALCSFSHGAHALDGTFWYNCTNITNDYAHERSATE